MGRVKAWAVAAVMAAAPVMAQDAQFTSVAPPVVMVDSERLYTDSTYGRSLRTQIETQITQLNIENERIIADLTAEEQDLAERRPDMDVDVFRAAAAAFDTKVQDIRQARDAKEAELGRAQTAARVQFYDEARPIVGQLMVDRGAVAVLDSRSIFVVVRSMDITNDAIAAIDAALLDGTE